MDILQRLFVLITIITPSLLLASDDAVNERIPVRPLEKELHWNIDCSSSWHSLLEAGCSAEKTLQRQLQLCAMIYQPPGETHPPQCPDFDSAYRSLQSRDCKKLNRLLVEQSDCLNKPE
ncbi:MAG: hypothetical protein V7746_02210 [Halioglobus sp.]